MATTELLQIAREIGPENTTLLLAMDVIRRHVDALPIQDRSDLVAAMDAGMRAQDNEEKREAFATMIEILSQTRMTATRLDASESPARPDGIQKWSDHIGSSIHKLRTEKGWTQEDLAKASGLPQSHISRLEAGQHSPSHVTVDKLALALGVPPEKLDPSR